MSNQLTTQYAQLASPDQIEMFTGLLNKQPPNKYITTNERAGNSKYLTIRYLEQKLDELFFGMWKSETTETKIVGNEYVVTVQVSFFHPVAKGWITRTGIGAVPIQQKRGAKPTDLDAKYTNAMQKNAPAAKAFAFKNAVKSIGPAFGRDLNSGDDDMPAFEPGTTQVIKFETQVEKAKEEIAAATLEELGPLYQKYKSLPTIPDAIVARRNQIKEQNKAA